MQAIPGGWQDLGCENLGAHVRLESSLCHMGNRRQEMRPRGPDRLCCRPSWASLEAQGSTDGLQAGGLMAAL